MRGMYLEGYQREMCLGLLLREWSLVSHQGLVDAWSSSSSSHGPPDSALSRVYGKRFLSLDEPAMNVGRSIGKGGQNVRDLQQQTGSVIKLPRQGSTTSEDTTVHIVGPFFSVQSAQRRIRAIIQMSAPSSSGGGSTGRPSRGPLMPRMHQ
ncbi:Insulin-like growth factor 2 mRNA-binding protein 2 [Chionoecetes opilio]|uniref:Insulin-like growth factor 2 mRNA-binding protein 2 n=1 Tax=Chionoecetes opilio TaxID=41210 RepID=A0A8J4YCW9_CHIOP|nr:Insulin-like growth factor 2 mRNA-binding protein 2 [Chionoecetes opilio]